MSISLAKSTLQYLPAQFLGPVVLFTTTVVWTHLLDPANFGVLAFVIAAQELTGLFGLTWWSMFVVRFQSRFAEADADIVLYGHTHCQVVKRVGSVLVINPGSAGDARDSSNNRQLSCAVLDLSSEEVQVIDYPDPRHARS